MYDPRPVHRYLSYYQHLRWYTGNVGPPFASNICEEICFG